jgi:muramoyltetrapeptide carboxypeptidase
MLIQLKHAGKLESVRGLVFGEMLNCVQNANQGYALEDVVLDILGDMGCPILYGFPTGHTSRPHVIVPFGVRARLRLDGNDAFELLEPAVAVE